MTRSFEIPKQWVWDAYKKVRANKGAAGVDGESLEAYESNLKGNLYKLWNRMSSGCYFPPPVRMVAIEKKDGGERQLGIPTVADRIAQMVAKQALEPLLEPHFHEDSYGYRPGRCQLDAIRVTRERCWKYDWVIDLDVKGFFDNIDHDLMMRAVRHHSGAKWILMYIERWLKAPGQMADGTQVERTKGTPQGGVISPLLANLFLHYAFDVWLAKHFPRVPFARYADDVILHCRSKSQAEKVLEAVRGRLAECGLELHPLKTRIVYCKDDNRRGDHEHVSFDYLGYTFRPRCARNRRGQYFVNFLPAMSTRAAQEVRSEIRAWNIPTAWSNRTLEAIASFVNPRIRGWWDYYGRFYGSVAQDVMSYMQMTILRWACRKLKRCRRSMRRATQWLRGVQQREPRLFAHWNLSTRS